MWRLKKRRALGCGLLCVCLVYIVKIEVEKSYENRKQKESVLSDLLVKPFSVDLDLDSYIRGEIVSETDSFGKHAFNVEVSNSIPFNRSVPDSRDFKCKDKIYSIPIRYAVSVVIAFHNEARSALLRTVMSILNRTPRGMLEEIILVDDFSDDARDGSELAKIPKVKIFRNNQRQGVSRARMIGFQKSSGTHVIFFDSHCEVNKDWLPPLLHAASQHPKALLSPVVDIIDSDTFQYRPSTGKLKGGFDWTLNFRWQPVNETGDSKRSESALFKSPVVHGGLFLVSKSWFNELKGLDKGLEIWGAENIEVSLKAWLCGGEVLTVPCSRVGHVFRSRHPYSFPPNGSLPTYYRNARRVAEAWLDHHKYQFYEIKPQAKKHAIASVDEILILKKKLKCKPFQWYLDNIYPELKPISKDALAIGQLRQESLCLQSQNKNNKTSIFLTACASSRSEQEWHLSKNGELQQGTLCMTAAKLNLKKPKIYLTKCTNNMKQKWSRRRRLLMLQGLCLENVMDTVIGKTYITLNPCRQKAYSQQWDFSVELQSWGDR